MNNDVTFSIVEGDVQQLVGASLEDIGFRERQDLQRWIENYPEFIGADLLVVTTELDAWEFGSDRVKDRLDVLFLDSTGSLLVAELKRGEAPDTVDLQALKYAAYCSQLTVEYIVGDHAKYHEVDTSTAREKILEHAPALEDGSVGAVKIRLVAEAFKPSVTSMVLWLRDYDMDVGCIQILVKRLPDGNAVITSRQLLPLPVAQDYLVRRRRRERDEEQREASGRRQNVVTELLSAGALEPETELNLKLDSFTKEEQDLLKSSLETNPATGKAVWTGLGLLKALRWNRDGELYSASGLVVRILQDNGSDARAAHGPRYWETPDGHTLLELADSLKQGVGESGTDE